MENKTPIVYAGIIDDIGRRQYSGNVTWLREYIQNAIDSGSTSIEIKLHGNDLEIADFGKGMNEDSLIAEAFSIGNSSKEKGDIGELGIGMYAGSGICDSISVRTKMRGERVFLATIDMGMYREIISKDRKTTFGSMMEKIFVVDEAEEGEPNSSFTFLRFEGLNRDTLNLIGRTDLKKFLEYTVNLPISDTFRHRDSLNSFLKGTSKEINIKLDLNGTVTQVEKFESKSTSFTDTFWSKDIKADDGNIIGKIWATYNKSGDSLENARILLKRKGLTVGDESLVQSEFHAKYSPRFFGEIVLLDDRIEINTSRDWFVASEYLLKFVEKTKILLNELYGIADFDSKVGIGVINLAKTNVRLNTRAISNEKKKNIGLAVEERDKIQRNEEKIIEKITQAQDFRVKAESGRVDLKDPTNKVKLELVERTLNNPEVKSYLSVPSTGGKPSLTKKPRRNAWPGIVITFLKEKIIDTELSGRIGGGDVKDTTDRAFTFIEQKLKGMLGKKEQEHIEWKELLNEFKRKYDPPDLNGFPLEEYMESFNGILNGTHSVFRNKSNHSFMDDMNNPRNLLEIILISDFLVHWLDQWIKK